MLAGDDEFPVITEVLDTVKTARYQLGTISHMSEDLETSVARLRAFLERVLAFLSDNRRVTFVAAGFIAAASLLNLVRGWFSSRFIRSWVYTFSSRFTPTGSQLHRMARDISRSRFRRRPR